MPNPRLKSFNYAVGMFGTSIPINMLKTYAAIYYVDSLGMTTVQFSLMLLIYTFIDALDNPVYGFLSDSTRSHWGRRRPWLVIGTPLLVLGFIAFYSPPAFLAGNSLVVYGLLGGAVILYMTLTSKEKTFQADEMKPQLWDSIKSLITNRKFWVAG